MPLRESDVDGGADHLARIHGTEADKVNCPFYYKIGACRHGDNCSRVHDKPTFSQTVIIPHIYHNPAVSFANAALNSSLDDILTKRRDFRKEDEDFDNFYIDVYEEICKYGEIDEMVVMDNVIEHMLGNVYVKFFDEEDAARCIEKLKGRYYQGQVCAPEFSPVSAFSVKCRCRMYDNNRCDRGDTCNYMHIRNPRQGLLKDLDRDQPYKGHRSREQKLSRDRSRSRSHSRKRRRSRSRSRSRRWSRSRNRHRSSSRSRRIKSPSRRHSRDRSSRHRSRSGSRGHRSYDRSKDDSRRRDLDDRESRTGVRHGEQHRSRDRRRSDERDRGRDRQRSSSLRGRDRKHDRDISPGRGKRDSERLSNTKDDKRTVDDGQDTPADKPLNISQEASEHYTLHSRSDSKVENFAKVTKAHLPGEKQSAKKPKGLVALTALPLTENEPSGIISRSNNEHNKPAEEAPPSGGNIEAVSQQAPDIVSSAEKVTKEAKLLVEGSGDMSASVLRKNVKSSPIKSQKSSKPISKVGASPSLVVGSDDTVVAEGEPSANISQSEDPNITENLTSRADAAINNHREGEDKPQESTAADSEKVESTAGKGELKKTKASPSKSKKSPKAKSKKSETPASGRKYSLRSKKTSE